MSTLSEPARSLRSSKGWHILLTCRTCARLSQLRDACNKFYNALQDNILGMSRRPMRLC